MCFLRYYKERDITADTNWWQLLVHIYAHLSTEVIRHLMLGIYPIFSGKFFVPLHKFTTESILFIYRKTYNLGIMLQHTGFLYCFQIIIVSFSLSILSPMFQHNPEMISSSFLLCVCLVSDAGVNSSVW